jgi:hypothetical protein
MFDARFRCNRAKNRNVNNIKWSGPVYNAALRFPQYILIEFAR